MANAEETKAPPVVNKPETGAVGGEAVKTIPAANKQAVATATEKAVQMTRQEAWEEAKKKYPHTKPEDIEEFHRQYAPDLILEWEKRCRERPTEAKKYFLLLADNFVAIDSVKDDDPEEYQRLLRQQLTESRLRELSRQIQLLAEPEVGETSPHRPLLRQNLMLELKQLLEQSFDEAQQRQLIEINRLEAEMRNLRRLADERAANRRLILGQRFYLLTGEVWPEDVQHDQLRD